MTTETLPESCGLAFVYSKLRIIKNDTNVSNRKYSADSVEAICDRVGCPLSAGIAVSFPILRGATESAVRDAFKFEVRFPESPVSRSMDWAIIECCPIYRELFPPPVA